MEATALWVRVDQLEREAAKRDELLSALLVARHPGDTDLDDSEAFTAASVSVLGLPLLLPWVVTYRPCLGSSLLPRAVAAPLSQVAAAACALSSYLGLPLVPPCSSSPYSSASVLARPQTPWALLVWLLLLSTFPCIRCLPRLVSCLCGSWILVLLFT